MIEHFTTYTWYKQIYPQIRNGIFNFVCKETYFSDLCTAEDIQLSLISRILILKFWTTFCKSFDSFFFFKKLNKSLYVFCWRIWFILYRHLANLVNCNYSITNLTIFGMGPDLINVIR